MKIKLTPLMAGLMFLALALASGCNKSSSGSTASASDIDDDSKGTVEQRVDKHGDEVMASDKKVEARAWMKDPKNRDAVLDVYKHYLRLDEPWMLDLYYKTYIEPVPVFPYTSVDDLREFVSYMPDGNKTLQNLNLSDFVDTSFLKRVEQEGVGPRR